LQAGHRYARDPNRDLACEAAVRGVASVRRAACVAQTAIGPGAAIADRPAVVLDELQLEGKKRISAEEFLRGFKIEEGERLV